MKKTKKLALCGILLALALALSYAERFIPLHLWIPVPGVKLGLANVVTLIALYLLGTASAYGILISRCVLGSVFGGGITGLVFSLAGGILAMAVMALSRRIRAFSVYGVSVLGAAFHNVGQILAAMVLMDSVYVGIYLPYLLIVGIFTGMVTGAAGAGVLGIVSKMKL